MEIIDKVISVARPFFDIINIVAYTVSVIGGGLIYYLFVQVKGLNRSNETLEADRDAAIGRARAADAARMAAEAARDAAQGTLDALVATIEDDENLWTRDPVRPPENFLTRKHDSIPILLMANLKGGVGKTTLAANLAAYFDARGERVLLIDLDYQGSLSSMAIEGGIANPKHPGAAALIEGGNPEREKLVGAEAPSRVIECYYPFFNAENRVLVRWLLGREEDDVRFRLARYLLGPRVQTTFDRVIIDTGPRVTVGMVNGLAAATHLVVPTQLNGLSAQAVSSFLFTASRLNAALGLGISAYRVVGMQKANGPGKALTNAEKVAIDNLHEIVRRYQKPPGAFLEDAMVPNKAVFAAHAGVAIAYRESPQARDAIDPLGAALAAFAPAHAELGAAE